MGTDRSCRRNVKGVVTVILLGMLLAGCGGGIAPTPAPDDLPDSSTPFSPYSARFHVEVGSGEVTASVPMTPAGAVNTAAILTGTAIGFEVGKLVDEPGNVGVKAFSVRVVNRTQRDLTNANLLFGPITNVDAWSDIRPQVEVSTFAGSGSASFADGHAGGAAFSGARGVAVDDQGNVYVADTANHRIRKIAGGLVTTLAGNGTAGALDGSGSGATFQFPSGLAFCARDRALYVAEHARHRIRRVDLSGRVSLVAGTGVAGYADGAGTVAKFNRPTGITSDGVDVYVTDLDGNRVRRLTYTGSNPYGAAAYTVSTVAGDGVADVVDGVGTWARFNHPAGICADGAGALYVTDNGGQRIRRLDSSGAVATIAGSGAIGNANGDGATASFTNPYDITCVRGSGGGLCLIVSDVGSHVLRQLRLQEGGSPASPTSWIVQTLAGAPNVCGDAGGKGGAARFNRPRQLAADASGNVYVADTDNNEVRRVRPTSGFFPVGVIAGTPSTEPVVLANADGFYPVAGGAPQPYLSCPSLAGGATSAPLTWSFTIPQNVSAFEFTVTLSARTDPRSPVEAVIGGNHGDKGSPRVLVRTLAGSTDGVNGYVDGVGVNARFRCIVGMDLDAGGNVFVADAENHAIRRVEPGGRVTSVAGATGTGSYADGRGHVAGLNYPCGLAVAPAGMFSVNLPGAVNATYMFVTDLDNDRVRLIRSPYDGWASYMPWEPWDPAFYQVATIAGDGTSGYVNGAGDVARFSAPDDIAIGPGGIVYVSERGGGNRVRTLRWIGGDPMVAANWRVSLLAGATDGSSGYVDAIASSARFYDPRGLTVGPDGNVYVADTYNECIRKITPDGLVSTLAGTNASGYVDGSSTVARFYRPWAVAAGPDGYLYVADRYNSRIRRVSPTGQVTTVAGTGSSTRSDGAGNASGHQDDLGIAVSRSGDLYIAEAECLRVIERIVDIGDAAAR